MTRPHHRTLAWLPLILGILAAGTQAQDTHTVVGRDLPEEWSREPGAFPFTDAAHRNAVLHAGLDSIRVRFGDGRRDIAVRVIQRPEGSYISLPDLGSICGGGFQWNPETWRGSVWVGSTKVLLVLDTQVFWVEGTPVQLPAPVRYAEEQVWISTGFIEGILLPLMGDQAVWDPQRGSLTIRPSGRLLRPITWTESAGSTVLSFTPVGEDSLRLRWDPIGELHVDIRGTSLPMDFIPPQDLPEGIRLARFQRTACGAELVFAVAPVWLGLMPEYLRGGVHDIRLTRRSRDVVRGRFSPLGAYLDAPPALTRGGSAGRTVVIEIPPAAELVSGRAYCLETLARTLQHNLETGFGHNVILLRDRAATGRFHSPAGTPEIPAVQPADCWIGFRLEHWPGSGVREMLLVTPLPAPHWVVPGDEAGMSGPGGSQGREYRDIELLTGRIVPWGQTARLHQRSSMRLARTLSEHLGHDWEGRPVRITSHPARVFRGVDMPAVMISPGLAEDLEALDLMCDPDALQRLVRNLSFGIDEFLTASSVR